MRTLTWFARVPGMADEHAEPTGELTERFRAFAETTDPAPNRALPLGLIAAGAVVLLLVMVVVWILLAA
jgi:hypothetical protein